MVKDRVVRRKRRRSQSRGQGRRSGSTRRAVLLLVAVVCAAGVAWLFRAGLDGSPKTEPPATSAGAAKAARPAGKRKPAPPDAARAPAEAPDRFEFYDMLPDAEVEITQQPKAAPLDPLPPVSVPGTYVIQAGAFPDFAEADKVKARLALLGIVSVIQQAEANGALFNRVRIGPIEDLNELNRLRARLRANRIDYVVIPVGE